MSGVASPPATDRTQPYGAVGRSAWLDVDWRRHQRWVQVAGRPVNVIDMGEGPALVFVHGLSGSWPNWLEQLPVFARDHRVIAMDLPGFGHSPMPSQEITISSYARILDELFEKLEVSAAAVVGNSMGGFISAELAIAFPQRVERLVLVSAAGIDSNGRQDVQRAVPTLRRLERVVAAYTTWVAAHSDAVARHPGLRNVALGLVTRHPSRLNPALAAEQLRGAGKPGFMQALQANLNYPIRERLPEIACPTLIVWGEEDRVIPVRDAGVFEELIPDSRKVLFEDTGHMAMLERPAAFNTLLEEFLGPEELLGPLALSS
ncbi:MAG TPA: alpha/beta hydrolase [Solirubrobacteraceae bacterium]|jgi:pimeloyl-ACP methyl ester carboxylesterase|nr:alpha/beta hydrolase [Solirubrobacteraceae bacterium]